MPNEINPTRRGFMVAGAFSALALPVLAATEAKGPLIEVWKTPTCGCCKEWVSHLERAGFKTTVHDVEDTSAIRAKKGIPLALASCHTGEVAGYALEGHVPASEIKRLLAERPQAVGLAVAGMPMGSPGMEGPPGAAQPQPRFDVLLVSKQGAPTVYRAYR
jgi:hypothetical protein